MSWMADGIGRLLAHYLEKPAQGYEPFTPSNADALRATLKPGDVLLVEGNNHISGVIKYLTQSTWSHAALYVGPIGDRETADGEPLVLVEANIGQGVVAAPLSKYIHCHTRICRPINLTADDCARVCAYAAERIGFDYDLKNIIDLMRYLFPLPVPQRWRRRLMALGSGHPTRIICSALIAQAFENVRYPILPKVTTVESEAARQEILEIRHSSLFAPRDFDISPYFEVVKPTLVKGFDYKAMAWADLPAADAERALVPAPDEAVAGETMSVLDYCGPCRFASAGLALACMLDAAFKALAQLFTRPLRAVLMKAVGLSLLLIVIIGIVLNRVFSALAHSGATWAEQTAGVAPHAAWASLAWVLSIMASLGIVTGALFLMPSITAFVGSFFVDEVGDAVERDSYPAEPPGHALPLLRALIEGVNFTVLSLLVYLCALPFIFFAGLGVIVLFLANAYLLSRQYFEFAAMRFRPPHEAKAMRKANAPYIFLAGMAIALFVSIPLVNLATPIFAMAYMVHIHKRMSGKRVELLEPAR